MKDTPRKKNYKKQENSSSVPIQRVEMCGFYANKLQYYRNVVSNIIIDTDVKTKHQYMTNNDCSQCIEECRNVYDKINDCDEFLKSIRGTENDSSKLLEENVIKLQEINDLLNKIIKSYGCVSVEQTITICFGHDYFNGLVKEPLYAKQQLLNRYFHPTSFKCFAWKDTRKKKDGLQPKNRIIEDHHIVESGVNFECFDLSRTSRFFEQKMFGIKVAYQNVQSQRTLIITGYLDSNIDLKCIDNSFINTTREALLRTKTLDIDTSNKTYVNFVEMLTLKDFLVYNIDELFKNYIGAVNQYELTKSKPLSQVVNEFMNTEISSQAKFIKNLIMHNHHHNSYYLCGILFSLLNEDVNGIVDDTIQHKIYESLPFECKFHLRKIKNDYNDNTSLFKKFNINKIPYEQRIEMLPVSDEVKEKAYQKLKEVSSKSEESGTKAHNYLDGLLKIPFGIYKEEPLFKSKNDLNALFKQLMGKMNEFILVLEQGDNCNFRETRKLFENMNTDCVKFNNVKNISDNIASHLRKLLSQALLDSCGKIGRFDVKKRIDNYNTAVRSIRLKYKSHADVRNIKRATTTGKKKNEMMSTFLCIFENNLMYLDHFDNDEVFEKLMSPFAFNDETIHLLKSIFSLTCRLKEQIDAINVVRKDAFKNINTCVYGHDTAKKQIKNIINQWITGEKSGYCFGFEGPPGIGKTSMAKMGLSRCLEDADGVFRPFDFIALGGSTNGSYLNGHSYTYLGSVWGRIVDILMSKKCMNPIIFIDELDKVSNSEYGKEIIGILTHLVDATQNTSFQDKYFSGIDIDLSKALFVFSYNDPSKIDSILLDRIHRIKFDKLTPYDKLVICHRYVIPEMNNKYGFSDDFVKIDDKTILYLIDNYTYESGVRKLKQLFFEIWGDINEMLLNGEIFSLEFEINETNVSSLFLKDRNKRLHIKIPTESSIGMINGLWANALGLGGLTHIQVKWFPCKTALELKLTGMQGDVMKESMNVAKTIAWNLLTEEERLAVWKKVHHDDGPCSGLHIHCPEGAVNKDGPSAGGAITISILSMFKEVHVNNEFAMTGEINLSGAITAIGGLEHKLYYGICAGARVFAIPEDNRKDFELFKERYSDKISDFEDVTFNFVKHIKDVCDIVF